MITIGFSLTVFSKLSLVRSIVATGGILSKKGRQCTLDNHVRRPVRALAHGTAALRLARGGARELARCARRKRPLAGAHRGPRPYARAGRRGRGHPAHARAARTILGRARRFP